MADCERCGHPPRSHRWGGANAHGSYRYLSSCRRCDCQQFVDEDGPVRRDIPD